MYTFTFTTPAGDYTVCRHSVIRHINRSNGL